MSTFVFFRVWERIFSSNSLTLAIFCLLHGFRCILLPTQQNKKPKPDQNMLNFYILSNLYIKKKQNRDKRNKKPNPDLNMLNYKFTKRIITNLLIN